ncbi:MAG: TonB-dependent receptor [Bacteroidota bacterium]|nr:TonB-dependent receptor [Bacteroidota bacterium]
MTKYIFILAILLTQLLTFVCNAQTTIKGNVTNTSGEKLTGATIILKGTIDGTISNGNGDYELFTHRKGTQVLTVSFLGYVPLTQSVEMKDTVINLNFQLRNNPTELKDIVISAGSFEASDKKKGVTLKPLDILTTPSANGDIYGAIATLPGTSVVGEDGRLFVRGGDAYESKTIIDGLVVKKPYNSSTPDLPTRGRFSPSLFAGTTFSSGGYSAQYGQALSSALILQTEGMPQKSQWGFGLLSVGVSGSETLVDSRTSASVSIDYSDLQPYFSAIKQRIKWIEAPQSIGGTLSIRQKIGQNGMLKVMSTFSSSEFKLWSPDYSNQGELMRIDLKNSNYFLNALYSDGWGDGWTLKLGSTLQVDRNKIKPGTSNVNEQDLYGQLKLVIRKEFSPILNILAGADITPNRYRQDYSEQSGFIYNGRVNDYGSALFTEAESMLFDKIAIRLGLRSEYSSVLNKSSVAPRLSMAWLISPNNQISFASGLFYQTPEETLLRFNKDLDFEQARHFILNYQHEKDGHIFRVELYAKDYFHLVRYDKNDPYNGKKYTSDGNGYARGIDLFWRDFKSLKNVDYWFSYSWINSQRIYRDYESKARPSFAPEHNFSAVGKWFVPKLQTQFGASLSVASGRPYDNPSESGFMQNETKYYMDLSLNASYIFPFMGKTSVLYTSVSNMTGRQNIFGYRYYQTAQGNYVADPVRPEATRFFLIGLFLNFK